MPSDKDLPQNTQTQDELQDELDDFDGALPNDANIVEGIEDGPIPLDDSTDSEDSAGDSTNKASSEAAKEKNSSVDKDVESSEIDEPADDVDTVAEDTSTTVDGDNVVDYQNQFEELKAQNLVLMERVNELAGAAVYPQAVDESKFESKPLDVEITEEDFVEAMQSAEGMKKVLGRIAAQARASAVEEARERMRMELPGLANDVWKAQSYVKGLLENFYTNNQDLKPVQQFVASVLTNIERENPGISHSELLNRAGKRTRELLKIQQQAQEDAANKARRKPAFATQKGAAKRGKQESELSELQKELDEL